MPDEDNLPVISLIWEKIPLGSGEGDEVFHVDVMRTLCAHNYVQTVPLLAPFVTDGFAGLKLKPRSLRSWDRTWERNRSRGWLGNKTVNDPRPQNQSPY